MKLSLGVDGIHSLFLVERTELFWYPLTIMFHLSLCEWIVPESYKEAKVIPVYKKGF